MILDAFMMEEWDKTKKIHREKNDLSPKIDERSLLMIRMIGLVLGAFLI